MLLVCYWALGEMGCLIVGENNYETRTANHDLGFVRCYQVTWAGSAEIIVKGKWYIQDKALIGPHAANKMQAQVAQIPVSPLS